MGGKEEISRELEAVGTSSVGQYDSNVIKIDAGTVVSYHSHDV